MGKQTEQKTLAKFREFLKNQGITKENNWVIEEQYSTNPAFTKLTSKTGKEGKGFPDFIITKEGYTEFVLIVEAKGPIDKLNKIIDNILSLDLKHINTYASNGAYHYSLSAVEQHDVLFIGCSGGDEIKQEVFFMQKGKTNYAKVTTVSLSNLSKDFKNTLIALNNLQVENTTELIKMPRQKTEIEITDDDAKNLSEDIHELLRDHSGVPVNQKPILISAVLLACDNPGFILMPDKFVYTYTDSRGSTVTVSSKDVPGLAGNSIKEGVIVLIAAIDKARNTGMEQAKLAKLESSFKFIETNSALNAYSKVLNCSSLYYLCKMIKGEYTYKLPKDKIVNILTKIKQHNLNDILGHFYSEFLSYGGSDGKGLGIVLTPAHITELMIDLVGFDLTSVLYDCCTGTAGFLVSGMNKAFKMVQEDITITDKDAVLDALKRNAFIGCEVEDYMFTIASTNMILRGDGKSKLFADSCFNLEQTIKALRPDKATFNPPYSLKDNSLKELKFIEHSLNVLVPGGICAAIVPKSIFLDKNKTLRSQLLKQHTLVAVITLPKDIFFGVAGTETGIGIFKAHVPHNSKIKTWLCEFNDGYEVVAKRGRIDKGNFEKLKETLLNHYINKTEVLGYSKLVSIEIEDECLYDCFLDTLKVDPIDFRERLKALVFNDFEKSFKPYLEENIISMPFKKYKLDKEEMKLEESKWKEFVIEEVFDVDKGISLSKEEQLIGELPFISASSFNNGVTNYIKNDIKTWENNITVASNGAPGVAFYHPYKFSASGDICVLKANVTLTPHIGTFLCICLEKLKAKYSYGKKLGKDRLLKEKIWLPIDEYGSINYDFMEKYIKSLAFSEILE